MASKEESTPREASSMRGLSERGKVQAEMAQGNVNSRLGTSQSRKIRTISDRREIFHDGLRGGSRMP